MFWIDALPSLRNGKLDRNAHGDNKISALTQTKKSDPPSNPVMARLSSLLCDVLNVPSIGAHDNIFALGDNLFSIGNLLERLEKEMNFDICPAVLLGNPTVHALACLYEIKAHDVRFPVVVPVRSNGIKKPVFCIHGKFGSALILRSLGPYLPEEYPLFEIQSQKLDGGKFTCPSIQILASTYIEYVRKLQPTGPYFLCGFSFGGPVAMEMACQLKSSGETISYLAVFDSRAPTCKQSSDALPTRLQGLMGEYLHFRSIGIRTYVSSRLSKLLAASSDGKGVMAHMIATIGRKVPVRMRRSYLGWNHVRLARAYRPSVYPDDVDVFHTSEGNETYKKAWLSAVSGHVTFITIPGTHANLHKMPFVVEFAQKLERRLAYFSIVERGADEAI